MTVRKQTRPAHTVLEVLLVGAIMVVLATLAYPLVSNMLHGKDGMTGKPGQQAALDKVRGRLAEARARAMNEGRPYRVAVVPNRGKIRVAPDSDEFWGGAGGSQGGKVLAGSLPSGSMFCSPDGAGAGSCPDIEDGSSDADDVSPSSYQNIVTFLPDGTAREDGSIGVQTAGAGRVIVRVQAGTSIVSVQEG
jgi:Tfp pilus assembly protein FimT